MRTISKRGAELFLHACFMQACVFLLFFYGGLKHRIIAQ